MSMSNGVTGGVFATLEDLQASKARVNTRLELISGANFKVSSVDDGANIQLSNGNFAIPIAPVSPFHFGAKADGVTDDYQAIQKAIDYSERVHMPSGNYVSSQAITSSKNGASIVGDGKDITVISFTGDTDGLIVDGQKVEIKGLKLVGNDFSGSKGLHLKNVIRGSLARDCTITNFGGTGDGAGLFVGGDDFESAWSVLCENINVEFCGRGVVVKNANNVALISCVSRLNRGDPLYMESLKVGQLTSGTYENSGESQGASNTVAMRLKECTRVALSGVYTEGCIDGAVELDNCQAISLSGCQLTGITSTTGIVANLINGSTHNSFSACTFDSVFNPSQLAINLDGTSSYNSFISSIIETDGSIASATPISDNSIGNTFIGVTKGVDLEPYGKVEFTPTIAFATNGDFSPTISNSSGVVSYNGSSADVLISISFDSNAYTTASGAFEITGLPFTVSNNANFAYVPLSLLTVNVSYPAGAIDAIATAVRGTDKIILQAKTNGGGTLFSNTGSFPASTSGFVVTISGRLFLD